MNNRYICRGKGNPKYNDSEWYYGYLTYDGSDYQIVDPEYGSCKRTIIPETVGQCTGLKDKNGKLIFEGDVFEGNKIDGKRKLYKFWYDDDEGAFVYGISYKGGYRLSIAKWCFKSENIEVIGNIHDNPELLEVEM